MLEHWHEFYELLGTAAAALVALLFVAASIGANVFTAESDGATRTFMSPVVFHYTNILFLCLIVLIPDQTIQSLGVILAIAALGSLIYSVMTFVRVWRHSFADVFDRLAYGSVPIVSYATGLVVAWLLLAGSGKAGLDLLAASALLLLVVNIRNAWDLMLSLSRRNAQQHQAEIELANRAPSPGSSSLPSPS
jgi:hypothetical protein